MGLDERSRAADSLASVLAVYDGFCNLKQVRPSVPELTASILLFFCSTLSASHTVLIRWRSFKALTSSPDLAFKDAP